MALSAPEDEISPNYRTVILWHVLLSPALLYIIEHILQICSRLSFHLMSFTNSFSRFEREWTCPLCRTLVKHADLRTFGDGSTSLFFQLF